MNVLEGVWSRAQEEWQEFSTQGECTSDPEALFCMGYIFGCAFGLALSSVRLDLVKIFEPQFRQRGWLDEHDRPNGNAGSRKS